MFVIRATLRDETRRINIEGKGFPPYDEVQQKLRIVFNLPSTAHTFWANVLLFPDDAQLARIKFKQHVCDAAEYAAAQKPFRSVPLTAPALVFTVLLSSDPRLDSIHNYHRANTLESKAGDLAINISSIEDKLTEKVTLITALEEKLFACTADDDELGVQFWTARVTEKREDAGSIEKELARCRAEFLAINDELERPDRLTKRTLRQLSLAEEKDEQVRASETRDELEAWRLSIEDDPSPFPPLDQVFATQATARRAPSSSFRPHSQGAFYARAEQLRQLLERCDPAASNSSPQAPTEATAAASTSQADDRYKPQFDTKVDMSLPPLPPKGTVFSANPIMQSRMEHLRSLLDRTGSPTTAPSEQPEHLTGPSSSAIPVPESAVRSTLLEDIRSHAEVNSEADGEAELAEEPAANARGHSGPTYPGGFPTFGVSNSLYPLRADLNETRAEISAKFNTFLKDQVGQLNRSITDALNAASTASAAAITTGISRATGVNDDKKDLPAVPIVTTATETKVEVGSQTVPEPEQERPIPGAFVQTPTLSQTPPASTRSATRHGRDHHKGGYRHKHISCDGCNTGIRGMRYKCEQCPDYDLCGSCLPLLHTGELHPSTHTFRAMLHRGLEDRVKLRNYGDEVSPTEPELRHPARCDLCSQTIIGIRWKCLNCPDWDACNTCAVTVSGTHPGHSFVKLHSAADYVNSAARDSRDNVAHPSIICDGCDKPLRGVRYKCMHPDCPDYDLCEKCESAPFPTHSASHPMLKIKTPLRVDVQASSIDPPLGQLGNFAAPPPRPSMGISRLPAPRGRMHPPVPPPASCPPPPPPLGMSNISGSVVDSYSYKPPPIAYWQPRPGSSLPLPPPPPPFLAPPPCPFPMKSEADKSKDKSVPPRPFAPPPRFAAAEAHKQHSHGFCGFAPPSGPPSWYDPLYIPASRPGVPSAAPPPPPPPPRPETASSRNFVDQDEEPAPAALAKPIAPDNRSPEESTESVIAAMSGLTIAGSIIVPNEDVPSPSSKAEDKEEEDEEDGYDTAVESQLRAVLAGATPVSVVPTSKDKGKAREENVSFVSDLTKGFQQRQLSGGAGTSLEQPALDHALGNILAALPAIPKDPVTPLDIFTSVRHVNIPPGTTLPVGTVFNKTWSVQHFASGSEFDFTRLRLVHKSANRPPVPTQLSLESCYSTLSFTPEEIKEGDVFNVTVDNMRVPNVPGEEIFEQWRFEDEKGVAYGQPLRLRFMVERTSSGESSLASSAVIMPAASMISTPSEISEAAAVALTASLPSAPVVPTVARSGSTDAMSDVITSSVPPSTTDDSDADDDDELVSIRSSAFSFSDISEAAAPSNAVEIESVHSAPRPSRSVTSDDEYDFVDESEDEETADEL